MEKEINQLRWLRNGGGLVALEIFTLLVLIAIIYLCGWPLLEEWGLFEAFRVQGVSYVWSAVVHTVRPLHLIPYAMQWLLGGGHRLTGVASGTALLLLLRYLVARWAVTPFLRGYGRWVVATMAATLVPWEGAWLGRYASAQLAAVFFFVVLGAVIRLFSRWSILWAGICSLCVLLLLATYQGLFLCLAVLPLALLLWHNGDQTRYVEPASTGFRIAAIYVAIGMGGVLYGLYWFAISHLLGSGIYEEGLAAGAGGSGAFVHIKAMYVTAYLHQAMELPLLAAIVCLLCWRGLATIKEGASQWLLLSLIFLCLMMLPLLGLIYVSELHLHDPERINYPLSVGLVLLAASLLIHFSRRRAGAMPGLSGVMIVLILLMNCGLVAASIRENVVLQKSVLRQAVSLVRKYKPQSLIIRDQTGKLGDVYTLYQTTLHEALAAMANENVAATICTPLSVDRLHPVANRFPIPSTPRCEDLPELKQGSSPGVLVTEWNGGTLKTEIGK